jgi:hypothetical protein
VFHHCLEEYKHSSSHDLAAMSMGTLLTNNQFADPTAITVMVCASYTLSRAPVLIFAGMQHLPAIRDQVSAFVSPLDARASTALTGVELLTARH